MSRARRWPITLHLTRRKCRPLTYPSSFAPCAETRNGFMSSIIHESSVHVMILCFVLCTCHGIVFCAVYKAMSMSKPGALCFGTRHCPASSARESVDFFDFVFTRYLGITKNHMKVMGQHLVIFSIDNPCICLTLIFHFIWASPKFTRKSWGCTWSSFQDPPPCVTH
jgi:hypothetical protein